MIKSGLLMRVAKKRDFRAGPVAQRGYNDSLLGQRRFLKTEHTSHVQPSRIGEFGVSDTNFGRTNADYGPQYGWTADQWKPLFNDPWVKKQMQQQEWEWVNQTESCWQEHVMNHNIGTYNNRGFANVTPTQRPVALTPLDCTQEAALLKWPRFVPEYSGAQKTREAVRGLFAN